MLISVTGAYEGGTIALQNHIVDMNEDGGYGRRVFTGTIESTGVSESVELIPVPNTSNEYWLIYNMRILNEIRVRKIVGDSVSVVINQTLPMSTHVTSGSSYMLKANATYNMLAMTHQGLQRLVLFDFDANTGLISVKKVVNTPFVNYGVEFSPNGKYIYLANWQGSPGMITQYDLDSDTFTTPFSYGSNNGGGLKLGSDGRIYVMRYGRYVGVIADPDVLLTSSGYDPNGFDLGISSDINISRGLTFSTGLTPPAICPPGLNQAPTAVDDHVTVFIDAPTVCVHVITNDFDPDPGDSISVVNVYFLNEADTAKLSVSYIVGDSLICLTPKAAAQTGDVVELI